MRRLWLLLLLCMLPVPVDAADRPNCRSDGSGITACVEDGGQTQLLIVDLSNPYVRVQTVMANDVLDVWPPEEERERIVDMVKRYQAEGLVAAINGDYFGADRGPEGPTAVQGQRLDNLVTIMANPSHYRRATLVVSRAGRAAITHLNPISSLISPVYRDLLFNAISGGPIILLNGQPLPEDLSCFLDRIPVNTCRRNRQTAAGVDEFGQTLFLAVSTQRSSRGMAELLRDYGASTAMKLDAGGSSQLWYRGRMLLDSPRSVADALLIFREDRPRQAAELMARPPVVLLETNAQDIVDVPLRNTGYLPWTFDRYYGLQHKAGFSLSGDFARLFDDVAPGAIGLISLTIKAPSYPGVFSSTWQMVLPGEAFGPEIPVQVVVIPREAPSLRQQIQPLLDRMASLSNQRFANAWPQTEGQIRKMLAAWKKDHQEAERHYR